MGQFKKTIGVLGGMGPETTVDFFSRLIKICEGKYGCRHDEDFPRIVVLTLPIPPVVERIESNGVLLQMLTEGIGKLISAGADFISIPCNTVHFYFDEMQRFSSVPILNIIEETVKRAKKEGCKKIGILATRTTIEKNLFGKYSNKYGIKMINPTEEEIDEISEIIYDIERGKLLKADLDKLKK